MSGAITDILKYEADLKEAGFTDKQAAICAKHSADMMENNLATKTDIALLKTDIAIAARDLKIWTGSIALGVIAAIGSILGIVHYFK